jgi:cellulose 1,4-beta-cellobiosidase
MLVRASFLRIGGLCFLPLALVAACATGVEPQGRGDDDGGTAATGGASGSVGSGGSVGGSSGSGGSGGSAAFGATGGSSGATGSGGTGGSTGGSGGSGGAGGTGGSTGGTGGAGGTGGSTGGSGGTGGTGGGGVACTPAGADGGSGEVVLQYRNNEDQSPADGDVKPIFNLKNTSGAELPLTEITIRYFYTKEPSSTDQSFDCFFVQMGCGNVTGSFAAVAPARPGADYYFEVGFSGGSLAAGAETGDLKLRFHTNPFTNFDETDDYSHCGAASNLDWDKVTVYRSGSLIWGAEP